MFGQYDGAAVFDLPDSHTMPAVSLAITSSGALSRFETHELIRVQRPDRGRRAGQGDHLPAARRLTDTPAVPACPPGRRVNAPRGARCWLGPEPAAGRARSARRAWPASEHLADATGVITGRGRRDVIFRRHSGRHISTPFWQPAPDRLRSCSTQAGLAQSTIRPAPSGIRSWRSIYPVRTAAARGAGGTGRFRADMPASMAPTTDSATFTLAHRLSSASTSTHGAAA